jgi:hypothetical protein
LDEFDQDVEEFLAVFVGSGEVGADGGEVAGAGEGAQTAGDFLSESHHADLPFGSVVVEWDSEV